MFIPHLHFCGDCEEAMALYGKAFKTEPDTIIRDNDGGIGHAEMRIHGQRFMLNNRFGNKARTTDCAIAAVITFASTDELLQCYEILKACGMTIDPMSKASYTELGVQFLDKFGVQWAFMVEN